MMLKKDDFRIISGIILLGLVIFFMKQFQILSQSSLNTFVMVFLSLFLEAFPFIVLGTILASLVHVFVSEELMQKFIPKNFFLGLLLSSVLGIFIPVCECASIPVSVSLYKKKVPLPMIITFLLSAPIVNPLVILSTYYAFSGNIAFVFARVFVGIFIAILIGLLFAFVSEKNILKKEDEEEEHHHSKGCKCHIHRKDESKIQTFLSHSISELTSLSKYFIFGAFFASAFNTFFPQSIIQSLADNIFLSIGMMIMFAYLLSICSETDAFIARTFLDRFPPAAILSFLTFGPMMDVKNTFMLTNYFKRKFIITLISTIFIVNFIMAYLIHLLRWLG